MGSDTLAANALLMQLIFLAAYGLDGFAFAAEGLSGTRLGARDLPGFYAAVHRCALWCAVSAALASLFFALLHGPLFALLTDLSEIRDLMAIYLPWLIALPLVAAPSYLLDGVFIGSAETREMMTTMLFSVPVVYLPTWYLTRDLGNHGLWLAFTLFNASRGVTLYYCYLLRSRRGGWLKAPRAA